MQRMAFGIVGLAASACLGVGLRHQHDAATQFENPLSVTLGVPNGDDAPQFLDLTFKDAHVDVIVRNVSSHAVILWQNNNSWGSSNASLKVTALDGHELRRPIRMVVKPAIWAANPASTFMLRPGQEIVRELYFKDLMWDGHAYDGVPRRTKDGKTVYEIVRDKVTFPPTAPRQDRENATIQAVFDTEDPASARYGVWQAYIESKPQTYNVQMPTD